ncbi:MAG: hypothetical protein RR454_02980 [Clostridia bacterium]
MCFCKRKNQSTKGNNLANLSSKIDVLLTINSDEAVKKALIELQEIIKFSNPCQNKVVLDIEKKINNTLDDIKILLASNKSVDKIFNAIKDATVAMAERNNAC